MNFDQKLKTHLKNNPRKKLNHIFDGDTYKEAATLTLLVKKNDGLDYIIFNKRTDLVEHHKNQICFPGGRRDDEDKDLIATAKRETHEEMGIRSKYIEILGQLGKIRTPTQYLITPYIGRLTEPQTYKPNPFEIDYIFEVSLEHLLNPINFHTESREYNNNSYEMPVFLYKDHKIWGATAKILKDLVDVIQDITSSNQENQNDRPL